jgi:hypothetical protein
MFGRRQRANILCVGLLGLHTAISERLLCIVFLPKLLHLKHIYELTLLIAENDNSFKNRKLVGSQM